MRRIRTSNNRSGRRRGVNQVISRSRALTKFACGCLMSIPFIADVFFFRHGYHSMTLISSLMLIGIMIGGPLAFVGLIQFMVGTGGLGSMTGLDITRIRIATEKEAMRKDK